MKKFSLYLLCIGLLACNKIENRKETGQQPPIFPDYIGVTIPKNMAPPTFTIKNVDAVYAEFFFEGELQFSAKGNSIDGINIPQKKAK